MKKQFKISIPKPCHEDWSTMTPKEKGRFCQSCSKTVVDFTKKSKEEIQDYLSENYGKRVCGHFRREQLDTITLEIPETTFLQTLSYQKLFLLALLFVMGGTLFSCQNSNGKKQRIENVILVDSIPTKTMVLDTIPDTKCSSKETNLPTIGKPEITELTGIMAIPDTSGIQELVLDSIQEVEELDGEVDLTVVGDLEDPDYEETEVVDIVLGYIIEEHPKFPQADSLSGEKAREDFNRRVRLFFEEHFKAPQGNLSLKSGQYKIFSQFTIDKEGKAVDIKIRAPHPALKKEVERVFKKLPNLIPAKQRGKNIRSKLSLPITIYID